MGESHEKESMIEGGGVFINREIEVEEREGLNSMERKQKKGTG
jgi:hypothetical protein